MPLTKAFVGAKTPRRKAIKLRAIMQDVIHFGCAHNLGATTFLSLFKLIFFDLFRFAIFRFDNFCELLLKIRIENIAIKSTIDAMLKTGELKEIIENGRIKLRATHQDF